MSRGLWFRIMLVGSSLAAFDRGVAAESAATRDAQARHPRVKMVTSAGEIELELDAERAPVTVLNFIRYTESKFYNGTIFHRIRPGVLIQGGGFTADMEEKSSGLYAAILNESGNGLKNVSGTIAMVRTADPDSAQAQFFINIADNSALDRPGSGCCVFGRVLAGKSTITKIEQAKKVVHPEDPSGQPVTPEKPIVIMSVTLSNEFDRKAVEAMARNAGESAEKLRTQKMADQVVRVQKAKAAQKARMQPAKAMPPERNPEVDIESEMEEVVKKLELETERKAVRSETGLASIVLKEGSGAHPRPTDKVEVTYTASLVDGTLLESCVDPAKPAVLATHRLFPGWREGIGLMRVGEKRKLIIPPRLTRGLRSPEKPIPPNSIVVLDVELHGIK